MEKWKNLKKILPVIGIVILIYIIIRSGPERIAEAFYSVEVLYLLPALLLIIPYILLQTYKWKYILDRQGIRLGFPYLVKVYLIGTFYSMLTPGRLGTFMRIGYIREKAEKSLGECSSSVVLDKAMDMLSLFAIAIIGLGLLAGYVFDMALITVTIAGFVLFVAALMFFMKRELSARVMRIVHRVMVPRRMKENAREAFEHFYGNMPGTGALIVPFVVTLAGWLGVYTASYMVALSMGMNIPFHIFVTAFPIATIIGLIPVTVSGFGTREAVLIAMFSSFGAGAGSIVAMSILAFVITGLAPALVGALLSLRE